MFLLALFRKRLGWKSTLGLLSLIFIDDCYTLLSYSEGRYISLLPLWTSFLVAEICVVYVFFVYLVKRWKLQERIGIFQFSRALDCATTPGVHTYSEPFIGEPDSAIE